MQQQQQTNCLLNSNQKSEHQVNDLNNNKNHKKIKILLSFLVGTIKERADTILNNLQILDTSPSFKEKYELDCQILQHGKYSDVKALGFFHPSVTSKCRVVLLYGFNFVAKMKQLDAFLLKKAGYDYISIILDDMALVPPNGNFDLEIFYDLVVQFELAIASPAVTKSYWRQMRPYGKRKPVKECPGRFSYMVELQAITFTLDAWECVGFATFFFFFFH